MKRMFVFDPDNPKREAVLAYMCEVIRDAGQSAQIVVSDPTRTTEQNERMWAMLDDIAKQVQWAVDGRMQFLASEDWKNILSASLKREQRVAQGVDGGFVILGQRTSRMGKRELSDLIEIIAAFGSERGVQWTEPKPGEKPQ